MLQPETPEVNLTCVFCDEAKIESRTPIEHEYGADGSVHYVFEPKDTQWPDRHLLVVPRIHVADATEDRYVAAMAMSVASRMAARFPATNIITSVGVPATQTVFHLHLHVLARRTGDGIMLPWSPMPLMPRRPRESPFGGEGTW